MKAVILAGGLGSRISEITKEIPKPLIKIGDNPIIWHIMKTFSIYNITEFIVCGGYKFDIMKEYFDNLNESWNIKLIDTGLNTMTGGRIKRIQKFLNGESFCLSYGDDLKRINIKHLIQFHKNQNKLVTLTAVKPPGRYGILKIKGNNVITITEKPPGDNNWINGGYYVLENKIFDYIKDDSTIWEQETLQKLVSENQVTAYRYDGLYYPMDTLSDMKKLESLWNNGDAYWKIWE